MNHVRKIALAMSMIMGISLFSACEGFRVLSFEERCVTTEEGFVYYEDADIGLCLIEVPDVEELIIPEYIDGKRVEQLGYEDVGIGYREQYTLIGRDIKKLTIGHPLYVCSASFNLEELIYVDYLYTISNAEKQDVVRVDNVVGNTFIGQNEDVQVFLKSSGKVLDSVANMPLVIELPQYITVIEVGVFDGLEGVTIKTAYESKPEGWEDGWNGNCLVEWGVEL